MTTSPGPRVSAARFINCVGRGMERGRLCRYCLSFRVWFEVRVRREMVIVVEEV